MATVTAKLTLTSSNATSDALNLSVSDVLSTTTPSVGLSRLDITTADILHKRKKPSLVVMGLRRQTKTMEKKQSTTNMYTIASKLNPITLIRFGLQWTFYTTKSVFGGLFLFVYSLLYPPQQTQ